MRFGRNGYGGYYFDNWEVYSSYSERDKEGNEVRGYCWCVKSDIDNKEIDFVGETLEECIEWILENR